MKFQSSNLILRLLWTVTVLGAMSGCALFHSSAPFGLATIEPVSTEQAEKVIASVAASGAEIHSFRLSGKLTVQGGGRSSQFTQTVVFERPKSLRAEVFSGPLNTWSGIVLSKDNELVSYAAAERKAYRGRITLCAAQKVLAVPLLPQEFALWLVGAISLPSTGLSKQPLVSRAQDGTLVVQVFLIDGRLFEILVTPKTEDAQKYAILAFDVRRASDRMLMFTSVRSKDSVEFGIPDQGVKGMYQVTKVSLNPDLSSLRDTLFNFSVPAGSAVEQFEENGSSSGFRCRN